MTGALIFAFRQAAAFVVGLSADIYARVQGEPRYLVLLVGGAALVGLLAALLLRIEPNARGGGIPTAIAILRGLIEFRWLRSILCVFSSAMLTYLGGVPLGTEGPSVQMGATVGRGTVEVLGRRNRAWDRYVMTGGACAGFAAATGAPLTAIFFAFEEAHRRFSPMIFMTAAITVMAGVTTTELLDRLAGVGGPMFHFVPGETLPLIDLWVPVLVGLVCGVIAVLFTRLYRLTDGLLNRTLDRVPFPVKIMLIFAAVAIIGFLASDCIGSGHALIDELLAGHGIWYMLVLYFCIRAILLLVANNAGITGGIFVPTLAFGAIIGALCANAGVAIGIFPASLYPTVVVIGMISFMSASSRTPITAIVFGAEVFFGFSGILSLIVGASFSFLVIEALGVEAFSDTVITHKVEKEHEGRQAQIVEAYLTVKAGAFAAGKEVRDILWPPTCVVLSVHRAPGGKHTPGLSPHDILHVRYQTYDPPLTMERMEALVGVQDGDTRIRMQEPEADHRVPET